MPYIEILAPRAAAAEKRQLTQAVTDGIVRSFGVAPSTVTIYFLAVGADDYAHAGDFGLPPASARVFVKVHAYRRHADQRRAVAEAMTPALAACSMPRLPASTMTSAILAPVSAAIWS